MRLSKAQLDHLQQAARFASGRGARRGPSVTDEAVAAGVDGHCDQAIGDAMRAAEQVARAADDVIRAAHDETSAAPIRNAEVTAPARYEIFVSAPTREVQLPPFVPPRRYRIPVVVALVALAFGATTSWFLFAGPRTNDQTWNPVALASEIGKALTQLPTGLDPMSRRFAVAVAPKEVAVSDTPTVPGRPTAQPGAMAPTESADRAHPVPTTEGRHIPASLSAVETAPVIAASPTVGPAVIEPSPVGDAPAPGPGVGVPAPKVANAAAPPILATVSAAPTEGLTACLASRPANLRLAREETANLVKRGEELMSEGRVSAARLVFQRAAEACDVRAAFALGASYDPIMLRKLGVALLDPNVPAARSWYERAKELGSSEASRELELLSNQH